MIHELLPMSSSKEMHILFKKKDSIMQLLACIRYLETSDDWVPDYDPTGDEGDIQRAHIAHIVNLREQTHNMNTCLESIHGVFIFMRDHTPPPAHEWFQSFLAEFQHLRTALDEDTADKTNTQLADQISRTLDAFTELFVKYYNIPTEGHEMTVNTENVGHTIVFRCDQLLYTVRAFASWVRLDVQALNEKCARIQQEIDVKLTFYTALDNKDFWFSTHDTVYPELRVLQG